MSPYEAGWRDGYNHRPVRKGYSPAYLTGYAAGQGDRVRVARILATLN